MITLLQPEDSGGEVWLEMWERTGKEPFAHPGYVRLFASAAARPVAVVDRQPHGSVLMPLLQRPVPTDLVWAASRGRTHGRDWTDAVSPYGYGGPFAEGVVDWTAFYAALLDWMRSDGVVTCFVRASLDHDTGAARHLPGYQPVYLADNVWVDLTRSREDQWRHYAHKVRKNVRKAEKAGLVATIHEHEVDTAELVRVYLETMDRRGADARYHFDEHFFSDALTIPGCSVVADVRSAAGDLVSTEVVLTSDRYLYSFLGGTRSQYFPYAPNDLLKTTVIDYGSHTGRTRFILGGGLTSGDGIFRYKRSFDNDGVVEFAGLRLVADQGRYDDLCSAAGVPHETQDQPGYFPAYRVGRLDSVV